MPHVSGGGGGRSGRLVYGPWARPGVGGKFYAGSRIHLNDPNDGTDRYLGSASLAKTNSRISQLSNGNTSMYTIIPKIQTTYGFADLGHIYNSEYDSDGDTTFVTTHKIGYEPKDRYAIGKETCNSFLFLSPINHSDLQVDGDTMESNRKVKSGESLRVPIIYQFRMSDYSGANGAIFGKPGLQETSLEVRNTKYANIIGIDIWTDRNALKPNQYDIIVYSTYGNTVDTNTNKTKTSSKQTLTSIGTEIVKKLDNLKTDSKTLPTSKKLNPVTKNLSIPIKSK